VSKLRLVFSDAAVADILDQADWYRSQSGQLLALRWERALASAIRDIVRRPAAGATCEFRSLELQDVRRILIPKFPRHLLFYRFTEEEVFVLRVVHGARDLETLFS
jgi:toxin ParE1/3/4